MLSFHSCINNGSEKNPCYNQKKNDCKICLISKKEIPVDENTSVMSMYMQYKDEENLLLVYNKFDNSIYAFNYEMGSSIWNIRLAEEGDNGVGDIQGFYYINKDSIFVYNYNTSFVYLVNSEAEVLLKKRLPVLDMRRNDFFPSYPWLQTNCPMLYWNDKLVLGGFASAESVVETSSNTPVTTIYDIQDDTILFRNNYPKQYQKYNWGGAFFRMPYFNINKEENLIMISFPQDHYLYAYSLSGDSLYNKYYAGSHFIDEIKAYDQKKGEEIDQNRASNWFFSTPSYRNIHYDPYRKLYYRFACLPVKEELKRKHISGTQPISLIVLDENFNYLGENLLPDSMDLRYSNSFVTKEGLNMQTLTDNDDLLTFCQFKVEIHE